MNEMQLFKSNDFGEIRTLETEDGRVLFCASDVAKSLGYSNKNDAISRHCKGVVKRDTLTKGGKQSLSFIPEGDVYRLIAHSKLPNAVQFESWVFDEVLPAIRRTGSYALSKPDSYTIEDPIERAKRWIEEKEQMLKLETTVSMQSQQIAELKPRADYTDRILKNRGLVTISQIAKDYGMSAVTMNRKLHELGIQYKQSGQWLLYSRYQNKGYTHSETIQITRADGREDVTMQTKWTQKGRLFIYGRMKSVGILPMIERDFEIES